MSVTDNFVHIQKRMEEAARKAGRDSALIELVAVSKNQPPEKIQQALEAGHRRFGENRVQEAIEHWRDYKKTYPDLRLHLIGPLQTNKARDAVALFDVIQTLDRPKLAEALVAEMKKQGKNIPCLIQVNTGAEEQKAGIDVKELPAFLEHCRGLGITVTGLMCIPPLDDPPALHFALLNKLANEHTLKELSMGMSGDFEKAIALGATMVRVGTALFDERE